MRVWLTRQCQLSGDARASCCWPPIGARARARSADYVVFVSRMFRLRERAHASTLLALWCAGTRARYVMHVPVALAASEVILPASFARWSAPGVLSTFVRYTLTSRMQVWSAPTRGRSARALPFASLGAHVFVACSVRVAPSAAHARSRAPGQPTSLRFLFACSFRLCMRAQLRWPRLCAGARECG